MEPEFVKVDLETDHLCTEVLAVLSHELSTLLAAIKENITAMLLEEMKCGQRKNAARCFGLSPKK
jgi:K+-sensing histidine kinase KdpD